MPQPVNIPANLQFTTASLNQSSRQVQQALGRITGQASEFQKSLDASTARVFAFGATTAVLQAVNQSFKKLVSTTIEVEKRLVEINSIFQASASEFNKFRNAIFQVAKDTGQAFSTVAEGAAELARQGLSAEETAKRLEAALILTRISGLDAEKSVKSLTAAINGFASAGLSAEQIVNKMVAVDTAFAVSAQDLADGFARAGSTAEDAGVSFDELLGLITAVEQRTARGGAVIGNAFKSIFTRLSRGKTIDELKELGVQIDANQTGIQKLQALSAALEEISDPTVASKIKELAGGVFQINVVSSTLKDLSSDTSIFAAAAETAANATNEAFEKNALLNKSLAAQINSLIASLTSFGEKVGQLTIAPLLGNLVAIATKVSEFFDKALDPEKGNKFIQGIFKAIGTFISGPGLILITTAFLKITMLVAKFAKEGFQAVLRIGSAQEKQAQIQGGIVGLLQRDAQLRKVLNSATATQAQKEQAVIQAIQRENQLLQQQQSLLQNIVGLAARRGVAGYSPSGGFTGKRGKRFAAGFQPSFADTAMEQISAKQHGYRAGNVYGTKLYDGQGGSFDAVVNSAETVKTMVGPNGKRGSFVIPPNGFAKGFVPNFAGLTNAKIFDAFKSGRLRKMRGRDAYQIDGVGEIIYASRLKNIKKAGKKAQAKEAARLQIDASNYGFLIPERNTIKNQEPIERSFKKGNKTYPYRMSGLSIRGPRIPLGHENKIFDPQDEEIRKNVVTSIIDASERFANILDPVLGKPSRMDVKRSMVKAGGAKGAVSAAVGAAFEAAVSAALKISPAKSREGGDFDVKNVEKESLKKIKTLFGIKNPSMTLLDFKSSASKGNMDSFAKKIFNEDEYLQNLSTQKRKRRSARKSKAAGYIPNFNSMNKGIPVSQIRAHFDPMGNPVAVTNTRDEPNGLKDAIGRERKGIGMAASGFVPNFAVTDIFKTSKERRKAIADNIRALRNSTKQLEISLRNAPTRQRAQIQNQLMANEKELSKVTKHAAKLQKKRNTQRLKSGESGEDSGMLSKGRVGAFMALQMGGQMLMDRTKGDTINIPYTKTGVDKQQVSDMFDYAAMGSAIAGPVGGIVGAAAASIVGAIRIRKGVGEEEKKKNRVTRAVDEKILRQRQSILAENNISLQKSMAYMNMPQAEALKKELAKYTEIIKSSKSSVSQVNDAAAKFNKAMEYAGKNFMAFRELQELHNSIKEVNAALERARMNIDVEMQKKVDVSKEAERRIGIARSVQNPNLTGVSKNIIDRAGTQEAAIASARTAKQEDAQLRRQLMEEKRKLTTSEPDLKRSKEIDKLLAESAKNLQDKIDQGAVSLYNNLTAAGAELETTIKKLAEQQSQAFNQRLDFVSSLKGKTLNPEVLMDNINAFKNAKTPQERLAAAERLAQSKSAMDAINPALFKGALAFGGITPEKQEELTREIIKASLEQFIPKGKMSDKDREKLISEIAAEQKKTEPNMDQTKKDIDNLNQEIKETGKKINEFGVEFNAEKINRAIAGIGASLQAFQDGMLDSTQILGQYASLNKKAEEAIKFSDKRIDDIMEYIKTKEAEKVGFESRITTLEQGLKKGP